MTEEHHDHRDEPVLVTSSGRMLRGVIIVAVVLAIGFVYIHTFWDAMFANPPPVTRLQAAAPPVQQPAVAGVTQITMLSGASVSGNPDYDPDDGKVPLGNKVVWTNADTSPHTATSGTGPEDANSGKAFDTGIINGGEKSKELDIAGGKVGDVIPYYCQVHPYMKSQITITEAEKGGSGSSGGAASGPAITIPSGASIQGNPSYTPADLSVKKGDSITVSNADTAAHTVTSGTSGEDPNSGKAFDTSIINGGESAKIDTANMSAGEYAFYCMVHPYMKGKLTVTE
ncbi:MAG: plastocyanin/azurin family copper-binding protein [Nitrososphaera sp.]|jgi:plastocyanin